MNEFISVVESCLKRGKLTTLQVNLGNLCNQGCLHCHVDASPDGRMIMAKSVIDDIIKFLSSNEGLILDITGGAPELNPYFDYFLNESRPLVKEIIVRSNLTVFFEPGKEYLPNLFQEHNVHLACSLPCYTQGNVDAQRGNGAFKKSIKALKLLNEVGYSRKNNLTLDIVYNPSGAYLPPQQEELEKEYKQHLGKDYGVTFNRLITITNVPIKRFKNYLESQGTYARYLDILKKSFNPQVIDNIMCRSFLSVGYDGKLFDCDFNQALGWALKDKAGNFLNIGTLNIKDLSNREILLGEHCFSCTAGSGSSCQGSLVKNDNFVQEDLDNLKETIIIQENVKSYYGKILKSKRDLKTNACCIDSSMPASHRKILDKIHPEILDKFYGCGSPIPVQLEGCTVLDLGCGTGKDVYLCSALVGEKGRVIGVDMTDEQLEVAGRHLEYQTKEFGFKKANVEFKKGYIEDLREIAIEDDSVDVVISNCVINLSPDKEAVFREIFRVLKPRGELYFSDVFAGRRIPEHLKTDPVLYGECLGGALYIEDFRRLLRKLGCPDYRIVSRKKIALNNPGIESKVGNIDFYSLTIRAFKLDDLEDICEDYGQVAIYLGTISDYPHSFTLDDHHVFIAHKAMLVCGNTAAMLQNTRYARHFKVMGDRSIHFGPFNCKPSDSQDAKIGACC